MHNEINKSLSWIPEVKRSLEMSHFISISGKEFAEDQINQDRDNSSSGLNLKNMSLAPTEDHEVSERI